MQLKKKTKKKFYHTDLNMGVIIIFIIVTLVFLLSLTKSNYSKNLFTQRTEVVK
ncbi:MAG: hypothetical protein V2I54_13965 [Bacteroidales bacterium]|jgi:hypothetical protein|nr:hypothetical protein [Bacteroidales bacterium]